MPREAFERSMAAVLMIGPAALLPMVSVPAVMLSISALVRPKLPPELVPRSVVVPAVGSSRTLPASVAVTGPLIARSAAVMLTVPLPVRLVMVRAELSILKIP